MALPRAKLIVKLREEYPRAFLATVATLCLFVGGISATCHADRKHKAATADLQDLSVHAAIYCAGVAMSLEKLHRALKRETDDCRLPRYALIDYNDQVNFCIAPKFVWNRTLQTPDNAVHEWLEALYDAGWKSDLIRNERNR